MFLDVFYTILLLGGASPDVTVIPSTVMTVEQCEARLKRADAEPPAPTDSVTGRPVVARFHKCVHVNVEAEIEKFERALTTNG